jgi:hypothetical protein
MKLGHVGRAVAKGIPLVAKGFSQKTLTAISQALMHQKNFKQKLKHTPTIQ